jgi:hypothetical protein
MLIKSCHRACLPQGKSSISDAVGMHPDIAIHECAFITADAVMVHAKSLDQGEVSVETGLMQSVMGITNLRVKDPTYL